MKKIDHVIILHGIGANPHVMWFPWLKRHLEKLGVHVDVPLLPHSFKPTYKEWATVARPYIQKATDTTLIIGHSLGCILALRMIEKDVPGKLGGLLMVAPPIARLTKVETFITFFGKRIPWKKIQAKVRAIHIIAAKNDPLVPYDHALRIGEFLDVKPRIEETGGHYAGLTALPLLRLIKPLLKK